MFRYEQSLTTIYEPGSDQIDLVTRKGLVNIRAKKAFP